MTCGQSPPLAVICFLRLAEGVPGGPSRGFKYNLRCGFMYLALAQITVHETTLNQEQFISVSNLEKH